MAQQTFAQLVHSILVGEKKWPVKSVAAQINMNEQTFYSRLYERTFFSVEEVRSLMAAAPDARFATYLLELSPFTPAQKTKSEEDVSSSVEGAAINNIVEAADVLREVQVGLANRRIDHVEKQKILKEVQDAEIALATLRHAIERA